MSPKANQNLNAAVINENHHLHQFPLHQSLSKNLVLSPLT
jgi:hypothetical protein